MRKIKSKTSNDLKGKTRLDSSIMANPGVESLWSQKGVLLLSETTNILRSRTTCENGLRGG